MKKIFFVLFIGLVLTACSGKVSPKLDEDFEKGFNGILWSEASRDAAAWLRSNQQLPVQIVRQTDENVLKQTRTMRDKYLKKLDLASTPEIDDTFFVTYLFTGLQYVMSFDKKDRFCAVTFASPKPSLPLTASKKPAETQKIFEAKVLKPLVAKYGKPRAVTEKSKEAQRKYWVWHGKKVDYVLEFIFVQAKDKTPAYWQYSDSIILASPQHLK